MDVPCFDLTEDDDEPPQLLSHAEGIQLTVSRDHDTVDTYGKETYNLLEQACLEIKYGKEENIGNNTLNTEEQYLEQAQKYTGLHRNVLYNLWKHPLQIEEIKEIDRIVIYNELMKYNLEKNVMPTATDLFNSLQNSLPPYLDIRSFRSTLVKMGYIFKKTDTNKVVVIENPAVRFERYMYLKNLTRYREKNTPVYYICEGAVGAEEILNVDECERLSDEWQHRFICAVSSKEVTGLTQVLKDFDFQTWILETFVDCNSCVIVVDNSKHYNEKFCEIPNQNSSKCDMTEWLKHHKIPFSFTMSRLELWMLIEKFTDTNANMYKIDNLLKNFGHKVLRIPDCLNNLTPAPFILQIIRKNLNRDVGNVNDLIKSFQHIFESITEKELSVIHSSIALEDNRLLDLDTRLDKVIDDLTASDCSELDTCLPNLSDLD